MKPSRGARRGARAASGLVRHIPVLLANVLETLEPADSETYIDATFGAGGYTRALLEHAQCRVLAIDRDEKAVRDGEALAAEFPGRLTIVNTRFGELQNATRDAGFDRVDGIVFDLGVSSMQLDEAERGFSFQSEGPLDMRMSRTGADAGATAADLVNTAEEADLANILFEYGEERRSRAIARAIVAARQTAPIKTTLQLAQIVSRVLARGKPDGRHPATRTFQALRIAVNDELGEVARGLSAAEALLRPGGRLAVVTFHSLEDRIVKRFLSSRSGKQAAGSRHLPPAEAGAAPSFRILNHRPITPSDDENAANPRARSAKLRGAVRTDAAPWPLDLDELSMPAGATGGSKGKR